MSSYCRVNRCGQRKHANHLLSPAKLSSADHDGIQKTKPTNKKSRSCSFLRAPLRSSADYRGMNKKSRDNTRNLTIKRKSQSTPMLPCASLSRIALLSEENDEDEDKDNPKQCSTTSGNNPRTVSGFYCANKTANTAKKRNKITQFFHFLLAAIKNKI